MANELHARIPLSKSMALFDIFEILKLLGKHTEIVQFQNNWYYKE